MMPMSESLSEVLRAWEASIGGAGELRERASMALLADAESLLANMQALSPEDALVWHRYLDITRRTSYLRSLPSDEDRTRWAETTFRAIEVSGYTLETMLVQRAQAHGERILFRERDDPERRGWTYEQVQRHLRLIAALFWASGADEPRVAIISENSIASACCDLACLAYDILDTPLDFNFDIETLAWICDELEINIVVVDAWTRYRRVLEVRKRTKRAFRIYYIDDAIVPEEGDESLAAGYSRFGPVQVARLLDDRRRLGLRDPATTMFTSGSTGRPKGVVFSQYNLITKRFARAAALPKVGESEILLCYLPLFHTFGRYLELMGMVFWGGTYVLAGNPSTETLLVLLRKIRPTGLISIPLRWVQIRERFHTEMAREENTGREAEVFAALTGGRLRWGLSAAGHLEAKAFRFFHRRGVEVCSGFGMTEGTGGITMTPPGRYRDNSVGIPLPGVRAHLTEEGELRIAGPYIATYLDEPPVSKDAEHWIATGDVFVRDADGYFEIVDRLKDIYKNTKGQTIAPRRVEQRYVDVPGMKRAFLVGDGRDHNVLLIVPDREDPIFKAAQNEEAVHSYFHHVVTAANLDLPVYERVTNFAILDRDFSLEQEELTPKGSYRRKLIQEHFAPVIRELYSRRFLVLSVGAINVRIPRWFFRDLGILENDIVAREDGVYNRHAKQFLAIETTDDTKRVRVGDLEYCVSGSDIDLGVFARQPMLWAGNPALTAFCPCKDGWDLELGSVSAQVFLLERRPVTPVDPPDPTRLRLPSDPHLLEVHRLSVIALHGSSVECRAATEDLGSRLLRADERLAGLIRRRLEALSRHPDIDVRSRAYRILLLDRYAPEYGQALPSFLYSGLPFLTQESMDSIAQSPLERRRLEAFRQRLYQYRMHLDWPASDATRGLFAHMFQLLTNLVRYHPEYYAAVREELVAWVMHPYDAALGEIAENALRGIVARLERGLGNDPHGEQLHREQVVFQDGLPEVETAKIWKLFTETSILKQAVALTFEGEKLELSDIAPTGIWVFRISLLHGTATYRISINTKLGKHFGLQLVLLNEADKEWLLRTVYWSITLHGYPYGPPMLPRFGCFLEESAAITLADISDLTVWERIRELINTPHAFSDPRMDKLWRRLFVRAMGAYFGGWRASGERIVPGAIDPTNVIVREPDFREGSVIRFLSNWQPYTGPASIIRPLLRNFYQQTITHFPSCRPKLQIAWIFDACMESIGAKATEAFLDRLSECMGHELVLDTDRTWLSHIEKYREHVQTEGYFPLALQSAISRYRSWHELTRDATPCAREEFVTRLQRLYGLGRFPEWARYVLYRQTYFEKATPKVLVPFDALLSEMARNPNRRPSSMVELSDLQSALDDRSDRMVFGRMVFPNASSAQELEILAVGEGGNRQVVLRSRIQLDAAVYTVREPLEASEVGQLYRLYVAAGFLKTITTQDRFLICLDERDEVIGGLCYRVERPTVAFLDAIVIVHGLRGRGLASDILENFCTRVVELGIKVVETHFVNMHFYERHGFKVDKRWGGLVRFLDGPEAMDASAEESECACMMARLEAEEHQQRTKREFEPSIKP